MSGRCKGSWTSQNAYVRGQSAKTRFPARWRRFRFTMASRRLAAFAQGSGLGPDVNGLWENRNFRIYADYPVSEPF